ncbi:hypothetical protein ACH492_39900 [Streptomyces sp. NPDC019443]|uniref:hypothetical protein n=1 Tax=Streptomyces sp. NPDC019443 TaxID=3365061 RepID=UPI0037945461
MLTPGRGNGGATTLTERADGLQHELRRFCGGWRLLQAGSKVVDLSNSIDDLLRVRLGSLHQGLPRDHVTGSWSQMRIEATSTVLALPEALHIAGCVAQGQDAGLTHREVR